MGIFPNDPAITRLVGAMLLEQSDEWTLQRRSCSLKACNPSAILPQLACQLYSAEHRVHLSLSGLWSYTTKRSGDKRPPCGNNWQRVEKKVVPMSIGASAMHPQ